ncbi:GAF domain-containing protein [Streptomyces sp. MS1.AVA.1]|uniref:GAF domain-containing protein n=1 Tax=Streptomyces machairae TaxID=3134109 RepID=A0ABU8UUG1_9ACTN
MQIIGSRGYDPALIEQFDGLPTDADLTPAGRALATGASLFFANRGELARLYPRAPQISDKHAWAFLPLLSSGRPIGCLLLAYNRPHTFTAAERSILTPSPVSSPRPWTVRASTTPSTTSPTPCSRPSCRTLCRPWPVWRSPPATFPPARV